MGGKQAKTAIPTPTVTVTRAVTLPKLLTKE